MEEGFSLLVRGNSLTLLAVDRCRTERRKRIEMERIKMRNLLLTLTLLMLVINSIQAQPSEDDEGMFSCITQDEHPINPATLPDNMRLLVHDREKVEMYLVNPQENTQQFIYTPGSAPVLFNNSTRMAIFNGTRIEAMNLDGKEFVTLLNGSIDYNLVNQLTDNRILLRARMVDGRLLDSEEKIYAVLDLMTGDIERLETPQLHDPEILRGEIRHHFYYGPTGRHIAYWAYQVDEDGNYLDELPFILRIQDIETDDWVDIEPNIPLNNRRQFDWFGNTEYVYVTVGDDPNFMIFDTEDGHLVDDVAPPDAWNNLSPWEIAESPNNPQLAIHYGWITLGIYDLSQHTWLPHCFQLQYPMESIGGNDYPRMFWTPDGRYLWWLEVADRNNYQWNLVLADVETGAYGIVAENVGWLSRIGFLNE